METITNPHDKLFRETWGDKETAADFLKNYLPEDLLPLIDLGSLEICRDSFVGNDLKEYYSDILYRVTIENSAGYVYFLFEHKSYPDRLIFLQLLEYMLGIWRLHLKQKKSRILPVIIPIVLYHGRSRWSYQTKFSGLFRISEKFRAYIPDFELILRDLTKYSDDEIRGTVFSRVVMLLFKHISDPDIDRKLPDIFSLMREVAESDNGLRFLEKILRYLFSTVENITPDQIKTMIGNSISEQKGDVTMTIAEILRNEGFEKGIRQGMQQGIREGLIEAIEAIAESKFGDEGLNIMPVIRRIQDIDRLRSVKNAVKTEKDLSAIKKIIEN